MIDRHEHLALMKVRDALNAYRPKIEEKARTPMENVAVAGDLYRWRSKYRKAAEEEMWNDIFAAKGTEKARAALRFLFSPIPGSNGDLMRTLNRSIYVDTQRGYDITPGDIVYELGNVLWNVIEPPARIIPSQREDVWRKGFAAYGEQVRFRDIYQIGVPRPRNGEHVEGTNLVAAVVKRYGPDVFLQIPREWQELDKKFS